MPERDSDSSEQIDRLTAIMICKAIGEKLRRDLAPEPSHLPPRLGDLLEQLRQGDSQDGR